MKLYAPKYYKDFLCIADKCKHSCCVGWEIDIDESTINKYASLSEDYGQAIQQSITHDDCPHFTLTADEKCPHLDERGLCKIIKNVGEEYLCDICREHPRFYNFTSRSKEVGLGMACEEACRIIISSDDFDQFIEIAELEDTDLPEINFNALEHRETLFNVLKDDTMSFDEKVGMIVDYYDIYITTRRSRNALAKLEYLFSEHKELFSKFHIADNPNSDCQKELSRILAYYIYRHSSEEEDYYGFRSSVGFSLLCTMLVETISEKSNIAEMARIVSEEIEYSESNTALLKSLF